MSNYVTDDDGYMVIMPDDYVFHTPPSDRIVAYARCTVCYERIPLTEYDDPDTVAACHC